MARATPPTAGSKAKSQEWPKDITEDYVSQTDTNDQTVGGKLTIAGDLVVSGSFTFSASGSVTGRYVPGTPITVAHGLGGTPSNVVLGVKGAQPYACGWTADATNIYFYPNTTAEVTISYIAW